MNYANVIKVSELKRRVKFQFGTLDSLALLDKLNAIYRCPQDASGRRLGPLVGYAGRYVDDSHPENKLQFVGDVYVNFALAEESPGLMMFFATLSPNWISSLKWQE